MQLAKLQKTNNTHEMKTDITKNKHGGNAQSNAAFKKIEETLTHRQNAVLGIIRDCVRATSKDVAYWLCSPLNAISGRITELKAMGKIKQIGRRDGCAVWAINEP
jgi:hypothetical protein